MFEELEHTWPLVINPGVVQYRHLGVVKGTLYREKIFEIEERTYEV